MTVKVVIKGDLRRLVVWLLVSTFRKEYWKIKMKFQKSGQTDNCWTCNQWLLYDYTPKKSQST